MKRKNISSIIGLVLVVLFFATMIYVYSYKDIHYKDYETIHKEEIQGIQGYEIPIAKNVELVNNRISNSVAYRKYDVLPEEYKTILKRLKEDEAEKHETAYIQELNGAMNEFGMDYQMSYQILSAEKEEIEAEAQDVGILQIYDVEFEIILSVDGEKKLAKTYQRKIAQIGEEWIFYDEGFSIVGNLFGKRYNKDDGKGE